MFFDEALVPALAPLTNQGDGQVVKAGNDVFDEGASCALEIRIGFV